MRFRNLMIVACVPAVGMAIYFIMSRGSPDVVPPPDVLLTAGPLPTADEFSALVRSDPIAALDASLRKYREQVRGYRCVLHKQERIGGELQPPESIRVAFQESPFSVLMLWDRGARQIGLGKVQGTLYVAGQNGGDMEVWRPKAFLTQTSASPRSKSARSAARFSIEEFGLHHAALRTYRAWSASRDRGEWKHEAIGVNPFTEITSRKCHVIRRTCLSDEFDAFIAGETPPVAPATAADSFRTITIALDAETWLQVGAELRNAKDELVGRYVFENVELNPTFPLKQFATDSFR